MRETNEALYRELPPVDDLLRREGMRELAGRYSRELVVGETRAVLESLRGQIGVGAHTRDSLLGELASLEAKVAGRLGARLQPSLRRVINATGVILQTNLGRAPLSAAALARVQEVAGGYCNLEFDLEAGERIWRDVHAEALLLRVLAARGGVDAEAFAAGKGAAVVNNCAAATFLALNAMAAGGEVVVSRGELVEIGGGFRIPEILERAGARLREVGTTNRTRIGDYEAAIGPETRLILRVHQANFHMVGFTERPSLEEVCALGAKRGVPVFDDQGTGALVDLEAYGLGERSSLWRSAMSGATMVAASGDKLLGGPQCGLLVGDREAIERLRRNPLFRALRVDKMVYAALEATLQAYLRGEEESVPAIAMMAAEPETLRARCEAWVRALQGGTLEAEVVPVRSVVGGGTTPAATLPGFAVGLKHGAMSEGALARQLRLMEPPVVGRVSEGRVLLDLRTVPAEEDAALPEAIRRAVEAVPGEDGVGEGGRGERRAEEAPAGAHKEL